MLYVSDFHHQRIVVRDPRGRFVRAFGTQGLGSGELWRVWDLALEGPDTVLVINERVKSAEDKTAVWEIKRFGKGVEQAAYPLAEPNRDPKAWPNSLVSLDADGYLVADTGLNVLLQFDRSWAYRGQWKSPKGGEPFVSPSAIRRSGDELWLVETRRHRVRRLRLDGRQILVFGEEGRDPGKLRFPRALAVCPQRWVVVADMGNYRVQRFTLEGHYLDGFEPKPAQPGSPVQILDVAVSPGCDRLYVVDSKGNRVLVCDPTGRLLDVIADW